MVIFFSLPYSFRRLVSTSSFFLREKKQNKTDDDRPTSILARSVSKPVCHLNVRLRYRDSNHVGEDLAAFSDAGCPCLWLLSSGFGDFVYPDIPLATMLLRIILCCLKRIYSFPLLIQLIEQVSVCLFHHGDLLSESISLTLHF